MRKLQLDIFLAIGFILYGVTQILGRTIALPVALIEFSKGVASAIMILGVFRTFLTRNGMTLPRAWKVNLMHKILRRST